MDGERSEKVEEEAEWLGSEGIFMGELSDWCCDAQA